MTHSPLYGGIEAGGTKWVCAIGTGPDDIRAETRFPTTTPAETLSRAVEFFRAHDAEQLAAIGVGSFGPVDLNPLSSLYGYITTTPKPGWANTDVVGTLQRALGRPIGFDTDVNVALLGEQQWGAARDCDVAVYITVGTGIGGGALVGGRLVHGLIHPEMGHIRLVRDPVRDPFTGICPYHGDCLEGLACGPAIKARWHASAEQLPADHPAWELEADYLGQAMATLLCILSPQRIIVGGGVMSQPHMFPRVRAATQRWLNGYLQHHHILVHPEQLIVPPALGSRAGVLGAIALAMRVAG
ncbi:ROK family protein [Chloroflexus sp. Y-396-1]|uniref:ROK family protein n=1 Tax=Chloroflexus sp. Y-396-1 TaxID=867845 RepID=UPI00048E4390|nr:ROK family protein [Chloroflexus sp. Y-396-1]